MTLVVEDGTGLANADAFVSQAYVDDYAASRELNDWLNGANDPEAAIRRATDYLNREYSWKGLKVRGRAQALSWPRTDVQDDEGDDVDVLSVPPEVEQACALLAIYEMANPGGLSPVSIQATRVRSERVGDLAITYASGTTTAADLQPTLVSVDDLLSGLLDGGENNGINGIAFRI